MRGGLRVTGNLLPMALTPRQQRFVDEYLVDLNATKAAIRAGYSEQTANQQGARLLANVNIQEAVRVAREEQSIRTKINADWVLRQFVQNVERASTAVPVLDSEGNPTGEYTYQGSVVNQALKHIGDHIGFFPGKDVKVDVGGKVDHEHSGTVALSFAEQLARLDDAFDEAAANERGEAGEAAQTAAVPVDDP